MEITARIQGILDELFAAEESLNDCFLVETVLAPGNHLNIYVDADSGITFEKCKKISRHLEAHLDTHGWLGEKYVLEVSSPGIGRPLKFLRQYLKNIGRTVAVSLLDQTLQEGILKAADEQQIVLEQTVVELVGKKKVKKQLDVIIPLDRIEKTVVKLSF